MGLSDALSYTDIIMNFQTCNGQVHVMALPIAKQPHLPSHAVKYCLSFYVGDFAMLHWLSRSASPVEIAGLLTSLGRFRN